MLHVNARKQTALRDKFDGLLPEVFWPALLIGSDYWFSPSISHNGSVGMLQSLLFTNVPIPMESRIFISLSGQSEHAKARQGSERFLKELSMLVSADFLNEKTFSQALTKL